MLESRAKQRIFSNAWDDFVLKVYSKNETPEYLLASIRDISEIGVSGLVEMGSEIKEKDILVGIIESDLTRSKIKYSGKIVWIRETSEGTEFGLKFSEEFLLPDVLIARSMAAA
ncbi:LEPBI_I2431 family sigma-54 regulated protein [Leptospira ilyithenensis]|uniref:PilZ domain-containing protein n=1 Tax=Leptospira ilyithenensis TaxID=2484901 RepID=A0A4R9LSJ7_9LEPT|nr:PilZ domain-containing protein [Leptospira ilyithenensis]TGN14375.1 PilZ domain-containing protein [Leptospira ilyithenensis]